MRPQPVTPKNETRSRAAFCETIATRSPGRDAELIECCGLPPGHARRAGRSAPQWARRLVRLVHDADAVAVHQRASFEEVSSCQRNPHLHTPRLAATLQRNGANGRGSNSDRVGAPDSLGPLAEISRCSARAPAGLAATVVA